MFNTKKRPKKSSPLRRLKLRFTPSAWAKLLFLRDLGPTEVGAFGIARSDDLLLLEEIQMVRQRCTETYVAFDDVAVAEHFEQQVDLGRRPEQCGRIWIHTHPGESAQPSRVDIETFQRVFGHCDWAVMFIVSRSGETYAELSWRHGGPASIRLRVEVDYSEPFPASDHEQWEDEYHSLVDPTTLEDPRLHDFEDDWQHLSPLGGDLDSRSPVRRQWRADPSDTPNRELAPF